MSWRDIPDTELAEDKFLAASTLRDLRDNVPALAEGAQGAPRIQTAALANSAVTAPKLASGAGERDWVLARTAAAGVGAVGTYALLRLDVYAVAHPGDIRPGSDLRYSSGEGSSVGNTVPGSWRCMGYAFVDSSGGGASPATLWLRVS